jgi:uncharacterized protein
MGVQINKVFNANIYADGGSLFGQADEVALPTIKVKESDAHEPLGFIGAIAYPAGFEKLDGCKIKWNGHYASAIQKFANIYQSIKLQVRFNIESYEGNSRVGQTAGIAYLTVRPMDVQAGNFKAKAGVELETNLFCTYIKMEIGGVDQYELDFEANIYKVDGIDLLATYRAILGI